MTPSPSSLGSDRTLALSYVPAKRRPSVEALWRLDAALGAVLAGGREPLISQIKLAWWREALEKLDREKAPAEPVLQALAEHVMPVVTGAALSGLEQGWAVLLSQDALSATDLGRYAERGRLIFRYSAELLGTQASAEVVQAGAVWAWADLARHSGEPDASAALQKVRQQSDAAYRWPVALRPLGMLWALARRDAERGLGRLEAPGAPARMARMLRHRFTGR